MNRSDPRQPAAVEDDRELAKDLRTLARFIDVYCRHKHRHRPRVAALLKHVDLTRLLRRPPRLCNECQKLLAHALIKRIQCPLEPKPACKHCPTHCYQPTYRARIREVMKYSGRKLVLSGRLDYLFKLVF